MFIASTLYHPIFSKYSARSSSLACSLNAQDQGHLLLTAGLHLQPLLPLFHSKGSPDVAFMQSYTKALYFVSECLLLLWLYTNSVIRYRHTTDLSMLEIVHVSGQSDCVHVALGFQQS